MTKLILTKIIFTAALLITVITASAQITITGQILNDRGVGMGGAYINVEDTKIVTLTDLDGNFTLVVPKEYADRKVTVSYAGYLQETFNVESGDIKITMKDREAQRIADIFVSTQKRLQNSVEVPIAVSVIDSAKIRQTGLYRIDEMAEFVPGFQCYIPSDHSIIYGIRGVSSKSAESYGQSRISVFMDGVSISRIQTAYVEQFDMERVEVVKGPQGTLFGRGAELGAVHYIRKKPTDQFGIDISALYGNYNQRKVVGVINTPIGNSFSNRFAFDYNAHDGFLKNEAGGRLNGQNTIALRNSSLFEFGDKTTLNLVFDYQHDDAPGYSYQCKTQYNLNGQVTTTDKSPFTTANLNLGKDLSMKRDLGGFVGLLDIDINDHFEINSTTGIRAYNTDETFDIDGTMLRILDGKDVNKGFQVSEELRCNWSLGKKLDGFFGASYFYERAQHQYVFSGSLKYVYPLAIGKNMRTTLSSLPEDIIKNTENKVEEWSNAKKQVYVGYEDLIDQLCAKLNSMVAERVRARVGQQFSDWFDVIYWERTPDFFNDTKKTINDVLIESINELIATDPGAAAITEGHSAEEIMESIDISTGLMRLSPVSDIPLADEHYEDETDYNRTNEASVFADFNWNIWKEFYLTLGLRGTYETLKTGYYSSSLIAPMLGSIIYTNTNGETVWTEKNYTSWVGRLIFNWMINPTHNVYLGAARGRRPGMIYYDYNPESIINLSPEITTSYELGVKGSTKYGHLSYALAFYYFSWKHFQTLVAGKGTSTSGSLSYISDDKGDAYGAGAELSGVYTFNPNVSIFADAAYNGGTFTEEDMNGNIQPNSGNLFEIVPQITFDIGLNWKRDISNNKTIYFYPSFYTQSKLYFDNDNREDLKQSAYLILNANAGLQLNRGKILYDFGIYGRNITNTKYYSDAGNAGDVIGLPTYEIGQPATFGVSVRLSLR